MSTAPASAGLFAPQWRWLTISIVSVMTLSAFESIATATVMPVVARDLDALTNYTWAFNAFIVASLLGMVVAGVWCDTDGPRVPMLAGIAALAVGSVASGAAVDLTTLIVGRAVQGVGAGAIIVAVYVVIARAFPAELRPKAFSAIASAWVVPSLIGPFIAGWLTDVVSWRWVFWLVPIIVIGPFITMRTRLRPFGGGEPRSDRGVRLRAGTVTAVGLLAVQDGVLRTGWIGALEAVLGILLAGWALRALLPAGTYRLGRGLPTTVLMRGLMAGAYFSAEVFVPLALVLLRGASTTMAGLALSGGAVTWSIGSVIQGRASASADRSRLVQLGAAIMAVSVLAVPLILQPSVPAWIVVLVWASAALGMGLAIPSISVQAMRLTPDSAQGATSSALQVVDSVLVVVTSSVIGLIYAAAERSGTVGAHTFTLIWGCAALVALLAVLLAPRMRPASA